MENLFSNDVIYIFYLSAVLLNVFVINSKAEIPTGYFTGSSYTWKAAKDSCKMIGLFDKIQVSENKSQYGWVDASAEYTPWVEYKKCYRVKPEYTVKNTVVTYGNQLQECLQFCKAYSYIGLQQDNCICLSLNNTDSTTALSECTPGTTETCRKDKFLYCANANISSYDFILYKTGNINEQFGIGNCLGFSSFSQRKYFQAQQCENMFSSLCTKDSATIITQPVPRNWTKSVELCADHQLISYKAYKKLERFDIGTFWLANIRRPIIRNVEDPQFCVAVVIRQGDNQVFEYVRPCNEPLPALCAASDISSTDKILFLSTPALEQKETRSNYNLLTALIITAFFAIGVVIAVIVLYVRRTSLRSDQHPTCDSSNEVTYENEPNDLTRNITNSNNFDQMQYQSLSQNRNPMERNYDTIQSANNQDVTSETDRQRQFVLMEPAEYMQVDADYQEIEDVST